MYFNFKTIKSMAKQKLPLGIQDFEELRKGNYLYVVKTVKGFASTATLEKDGKSCDMRKLMALMGMGVKQGETVTIKVEGDDEEAAAEAIQKFLSENV